ncbi:MAG: COX15/CtaA family protein [Pseudomonadota bacterium]
MKLISRLALSGAVMAFVVIVLGAWVRLSDAGLGCPDWPGCYGHALVPLGEDVAAANEAYPERPVETDKAIKEMVHRYVAALLGLVILVITWIAWKHRRAGAPLGHAVALLALVIFQGMLGMWTVTLLVKPAVVTAHLFGGLATLSLLWLLYLRTRDVPVDDGDRDPQAAAARPLLWVAMLALLGQIFLGGWTSTNYAALSCPELPTCQGQWWPEMNFDDAFTLWRGLGVDYEFGVLPNESRVAVHISHRIGAIVASALLILAAFSVMRHAGAPRTAAFGRMLLGVLALQLVLGVSNIVFHLPLWVATAHNGGAALLLLTMVMLLHRCRRYPLAQ